MISGRDLLRRADELAAITETPPALTRTYLTPEHRRAADLVIGWMREAGMTARPAEAGNAAGRYEGAAPGAPCLMMGSHLDTVRGGGVLGVITAIACVADLDKAGTRIPFSKEVVGFGDKEAVSSHNATEAITAEDAEVCTLFLLHFIRDFKPEASTR